MVLPQNFGLAMLITLFAGLTTAIGGAVAFIVKKDNLKALSVGLGFSAGVMIFLSFTDIIPEAGEMRRHKIRTPDIRLSGRDHHELRARTGQRGGTAERHQHKGDGAPFPPGPDKGDIARQGDTVILFLFLQFKRGTAPVRRRKGNFLRMSEKHKDGTGPSDRQAQQETDFKKHTAPARLLHAVL